MQRCVSYLDYRSCCHLFCHALISDVCTVRLCVWLCAQPCGVYSLSVFADRVRAVKACVNLARVALSMRDNVIPSPVPFFKVVTRSHSKVLLGFDAVKKKYTQPVDPAVQDVQDVRKQLCAFYRQCRDVPFLESGQPCRDHGWDFRLTPVGLQRMPADDVELLEALGCVLVALEGVHRRGYAFVDVRWMNIVLVRGFAGKPDGWYLIDAELARPLGSAVPQGLRLQYSNGSAVASRRFDFHQFCALLETTLPFRTDTERHNELRRELREVLRSTAEDEDDKIAEKLRSILEHHRRSYVQSQSS